MIDTLAMHAREKLDLPADMQPRRYENLDGQAFKLTFRAPCGVFKSGPRKGEERFGKEGERVFICSIAEHRAWEAAWCERESKCRECFGERELFVSWDSATGRKTRVCPVCNGTGLLGPAFVGKEVGNG